MAIAHQLDYNYDTLTKNKDAITTVIQQASSPSTNRMNQKKRVNHVQRVKVLIHLSKPIYPEINSTSSARTGGSASSSNRRTVPDVPDATRTERRAVSAPPTKPKKSTTCSVLWARSPACRPR
ncbi:hypothetical protein NMG60_11014703 [Bertholletia excelsa]